jgi:hypothetical protein
MQTRRTINFSPECFITLFILASTKGIPFETNFINLETAKGRGAFSLACGQFDEVALLRADLPTSAVYLHSRYLHLKLIKPTKGLANTTWASARGLKSPNNQPFTQWGNIDYV